MDLVSVVDALERLDLQHAPPAALVALLTACAAAQSHIAARLANASAEAPAPASAEPERFISVAAAAARLGVAPKWIYRRRRKLAFVRELTPGTLRISLSALENFMHDRGRR